MTYAAHSPLKKGQGDWTKLTVAKTSGFVARTGKNWPIADQRAPSNDPRSDCGTHLGSGARFSKVPIINGPVKLLSFICKIEVSVGFISNMIKLSVSKTKWNSLLTRTRALILYISIFILLHEKFLQFDWLRAVVFQLNLKYLHEKITNLL